MHRSIPLLQKRGRMISARRGQRRILKRRLPLLEYIEKAVNTGIYRTNDEIHASLRAMRRGDATLFEPEVAVDRFRKDIIRGTQVQDYPFEYHVLKMFPPLPKPPHIPKKYKRKMELARKAHPTEKLVASYIKRQEKPEATTEDYYRNLLGLKPPPENFAMGQRSAAISKAYAYAVKQWEVMRTQDVSETEALKIVDELLAEENQKEAHSSRATREEIDEWTTQKNHNHASSKNTKKIGKLFKKTLKSSSDDDDNKAGSTSREEDLNNYLPSILHNRPRTVEGMLQWSRMLQNSGVPYQEWTVGATTALDHWIAKNILDISEQTWDALLEGTDPKLLSRGQDIVAVRETLFPETRLEVHDTASDEFHEQLEFQEQMERERDQRDEADPPASPEPAPADDKNKEDASMPSVDELLASLRGLDRDDQEGDKQQQKGAQDAPKASAWSFGDDEAAATATTTPEEDNKWGMFSSSFDDDDGGPRDAIQILTDELQQWRAMNAKTPYDEWPQQERHRFEMWLDQYLNILTTEVDRALVDRNETRIALLSSPPQTQEESNKFWNSIGDETKADKFLQKLLKDGPPKEGLTEDQKLFWSLSYENQLEKLINLGTLRPLLDDFATDKQRVDFMRRYGDYLLDGIYLDHLVPDPNGPVSGMDLGAEIIRTWNIHQDDRFRLVKLPYKSGLSGDPEEEEDDCNGADKGDKDEDGKEPLDGRDIAMKRSRALYQAWNRHKAGRARYEEQMFIQGDLALHYDMKTPNEIDNEMERRMTTETDPVIDPMKKKKKDKKK